MSVVKSRDEMTRQELISFILRNCALMCDPRYGRLKALAEAIDTHEVTVSVWISQGYVPEHQVRKLQKRFGKKSAPIDDLCPVEFRRN